ncbi:Uncharacterised protein [Algoriella xinjiangensis]|uniref:hypothetical protein n=1 Tax=Algoriella xinjiangensis TaxID=684065 RepID=UPI000F62D4B1|nr:hypothetical protein [Algoriella xinjiangensis]VDH16725.1 Uncharacterised protein [Algoriella xinjiangensis]
MSLRILKLSKYGKVKTCKVVNNEIVTIVLTDGFNINTKNTISFIEECTNLFPEFPVLETCITEENLAIMVLVR